MKYLIIVLLFLSCATQQPGLSDSKNQVNDITDDISQKKELKLCTIGDTGKLTQGLYDNIAAIYKSECSHVMLLGDLYYGPGFPISKGLRSPDDEGFNDVILQPWHKPIHSGVKLLAVLGNHDRLAKESSWFELHKRHDWLHSPDYNWKYKIGNVCIIAFYPARKAKVEDFFENLDMSDCSYSIAISHFPYETAGIGGHSNAKWYKKKIMERYVVNKFDVFMSGHIHKLAMTGKKGRTEFIISGSGAKKDEVKKGHTAPFVASKHGFVLTTFKDDHVLHEFKDQDGNTLFGFED